MERNAASHINAAPEVLFVALSHQPIPCERCGEKTTLTVHMPPQGGTAGARIYRCVACSHHTWVAWQPPPPQEQQSIFRPDGQPQQQQQQQQQQQSQRSAKSEERETRIYTMVVGTWMVCLILFGVLQLLGWIRV